jgi:predicted kinase
MQGLPGSGKSTYIKENLKNCKVISRDIIRHELGLTKSVDDKKVCSWKEEIFVSLKENNEIYDALKNCQDFVIDDINIRRKHFCQLTKSIRTLSKYFNYPVKITVIRLITPIETCIERRKNQIEETEMNRINRLTKWFEDDNIKYYIDELINI